MLHSFRVLLTSAILLAAPLALHAQTYTVGQTYYGADNYVEYQPGDLPIIITAPHGGLLNVSSSLIPDRANGTFNGVTYDDILTDNDTNTQDLARKVAAEIYTRTGHRPHLVINLLPRIKMDANREIGAAALGNARAEQAWRDYHETFLAAAKSAALATIANDGSGLTPFYFCIDLHGHGTSHPDRLELGYNLSYTDLNVSDAALDRPGVLYDTSVRTLPLVRPGVTLATVLRGPRSVGDFMETLGFASSPSPLVPAPDNTNFFQGGYTTRTHTCWSDNLGDHGLQIECHYTGVRDTSANRTAFAQALAQALNGFLFDNYGYRLGTSSLYSLSAATPTLTAGGAAVTVTVDRTGYKSFADTLALTFGGNAGRNTDYTVSADTVTFSSGQTSRTFVITPLANASSADKTLTVALAPVVPQTADTTPLTLALASGPTPIVRVTVPTDTVSEAAGTAAFTLTRTNTSGPLTVNLAWTGDAVPRRHYRSPGNTATFAAGESSLAVAVPLVNDGIVQPSRQLMLTIATGSGYLVGASSSATITITDDDRPPGLALWLARGPGATGRLTDESGLGRHGAGVPGYSPSSTTWSMGTASGTALAFNGAYQTAFVPRFAIDPSNAFTLSFRFSSSSTNTINQNLISLGQRGDPGSLHVYVAGSTTLRTSLNDSTGGLSSSALDTTVSGLGNGTWHLYTLTVDPSGGRKVYLDGALAKSASGWSGSLNSTELFWLGWRAQATTSSSGYYTGSLADVRVYQRALAAAEVATLSSSTYTFASWLAEEGLPSTASVSEDNDSDGWPNALEYSLGSHGNAAASVPQVTATRANGTVQFDFARRTDTTDVALALQSATSATGPWLSLATLAPGASTWNVDPSITVTDNAGLVTLLVTGETTPRYWRLRAVVGLNSASYDITPPIAPVFVTQPASQTLADGATLTLTAQASGIPEPTYQWSKTGTPLSGQTSATLTLPNARAVDSGDYTVTATNSGGSITSDIAHVQIGAAPAITVRPASLSVVVGSAATFSVTATGSAPLTYQWAKNGTARVGATAATFSLPNAQLADAGDYTVTISNPLGSITSDAATLSVTTSPVAPAISTPPLSQNAALGGTVTFTVEATGSAPFAYQWSKDGTALTGATSSSLVLSSLTAASAGAYTVTVTNSGGLVTSAAAILAVNPPTYLANLSVRASMAAQQTLILGFVVTGGSKPVLVRAAGPALHDTFDLAGYLADPQLTLHAANGDVLATNDNWDSALAATAATLGAFPFVAGSKDAALLQTVTSANTTHAPADAAGGIQLVELYDAGENNGVKLANVSARNHVGTGDSILIAGFVIVGSSNKQILIRGIGPGLARKFNVQGVLADPKLTLFDSHGQLITGNDDWEATLAATFATLGAFDLAPGSKDAALLIELAPGVYTAQVAGADGGTGEALVEIYDAAP